MRVRNVFSTLLTVSAVALAAPFGARAQNVPGGFQNFGNLQNGINNAAIQNGWAGQHGPNFAGQAGQINQIGAGNGGFQTFWTQQSGAGNTGIQGLNLNQLGNGNLGSQQLWLQQGGSGNTAGQFGNLTQYGPGNVGTQFGSIGQYGTNNSALQNLNQVQGGYYDPTQILRSTQIGGGNTSVQGATFYQAH